LPRIFLGDRDEDQGTKYFKRKSPEIIPGAVNYEVVIKIGAGETIVVVTLQELVESPGLRAGWELKIVRRNKKAGACAGFVVLATN